MDIYLPIAEMSVNAGIIAALGAIVGFLSGMFGVGGGFLTTPFLIFYGIPPAIAVASSTTQITGASISGVIAYFRRRQVDVKMGLLLVVGGFVGSIAGSMLFTWLKRLGQIDITINLVYVLLLGSVGLMMLNEAVRATLQSSQGKTKPPQKRRRHPLVASLPMPVRFQRSGVYMSPLAPLVLGFIVGVLTIIMGVGGGFIMVPAMLYILGMSAGAVVGTSLFQIMFVTGWATLLHATQSQSVDIILVALLLVGGVIGAQFGAIAAQKLPAERLRLLLALLVVGVAVRLAFDLTVTPADLYTIQVAS